MVIFTILANPDNLFPDVTTHSFHIEYSRFVVDNCHI